MDLGFFLCVGRTKKGKIDVIMSFYPRTPNKGVFFKLCLDILLL